MKLVRIKDNTQIKKDKLSEIESITSKVTDKTLEQLEKEGIFVFPEIIKDAEDITKNQMILQSVNDSYRSGNIMGFLGYGNEQLIIQSRFSTDDNDFLFLYLLDRVLNLSNIINL